jgi:hypothetical protein
VPVPDIKRWTAELRKIERQFDGLPVDPSATNLRIKRQVERRTRERRDEQFRVAGTWARVVLIAALAGATTFWWPYPHVCGQGLLTYLAAGVLLVLGSIWAMTATWQIRIASAHVVAMVFLLWGLAFVSIQIVPRTSLAASIGMRPSAWRCNATP